MPGASLRIGLIVALSSGVGGCSASAPPAARCVISEQVSQVSVFNVDRTDFLFVIDDTPSMAGAQAQLQRELPQLVQMLATGELSATERVDPMQDLHVGVVSATFADGGALHRVPSVGGDGCAAQYPGFLSYRGPYFEINHDDATTFVHDFGCMAQLGADGQGPSQPLEAALRALRDPNAARGFLRNDPVKGLSLIVVVVVTDVDDCSASGGAASGSPPASTAECAAREDALQSLERYLQELKALRTGNENLVLFAAIAGVPPELVDPAARARADFTSPTQAALYYDRILSSPAMQPVPDPAAPGRLQPACSHGGVAAEPGRRLIRLAQRFGENGLAVSICSEGWGASVLPFSDNRIAKQLGSLCLPYTLERGPDGRVDGCKVFWDLPPAAAGFDGTPTACSDRPFLSPAPGKAQRPGGQRCEVRQVAIRNDAELAAADLQAGFYYDDFSQFTLKTCAGPVKANISFTDFAVPMSGVSVTLDCFTARVEAPGDAGTQSLAACNVTGPSDARWKYAAVGAPCMPAEIPSHGFDDRGVWIETGASDCRTGVCMVYHLRGDPRPGCVPSSALEPQQLPVQCSDSRDVADRMYCSCSCAGAGPSSCACPQGYSCREVLAQGAPDLPGSYCVKDGTFPGL